MRGGTPEPGTGIVPRTTRSSCVPRFWITVGGETNGRGQRAPSPPKATSAKYLLPSARVTIFTAWVLHDISGAAVGGRRKGRAGTESVPAREITLGHSVLTQADAHAGDVSREIVGAQDVVEKSGAFMTISAAAVLSQLDGEVGRLE
jgi:hypothetical protein